MRGRYWPLIAVLSMCGLPSAAQQSEPQAQQPQAQQPQAQQPQAQQPQAQQPQAQQPVAPEGFFRPTDDPTLTRFPDLAHRPSDQRPSAEAAPQATEVLAQVRAREALERELDRAERADALAQVQAARRPSPLIASPLDGTAPIVSPLDR